MSETQSKKGDYKRSTGFVEIEVLRADGYNEVTTKIAECLEIFTDGDDFLALFKLNGSRIIDKELTINGKKRPWLIGNYLSFVKKSAAQLKLGIGICRRNKEVSTIMRIKNSINNCMPIIIIINYMSRNAVQF